jgi:hypothetical protein
MLAEVVDAVVGVDTHRDTHEVEIASSKRSLGSPAGSANATSNPGGPVLPATLDDDDTASDGTHQHPRLIVTLAH